MFWKYCLVLQLLTYYIHMWGKKRGCHCIQVTWVKEESVLSIHLHKNFCWTGVKNVHFTSDCTHLSVSTVTIHTLSVFTFSSHYSYFWVDQSLQWHHLQPPAICAKYTGVSKISSLLKKWITLQRKITSQQQEKLVTDIVHTLSHRTGLENALGNECGYRLVDQWWLMNTKQYRNLTNW